MGSRRPRVGPGSRPIPRIQTCRTRRWSRWGWPAGTSGPHAHPPLRPVRTGGAWDQEAVGCGFAWILKPSAIVATIRASAACLSTSRPLGHLLDGHDHPGDRRLLNTEHQQEKADHGSASSISSSFGLQGNELCVEVGRVEEGVETDLALPVDDEVCGDRHLVSRQIRENTGRRVALRRLPIQVEQDPLKPRALAVALGHRSSLEHVYDPRLNTSLTVVLLQRLEMRSLRIAEWSPAGGEVQDDDATTEVLKRPPRRRPRPGKVAPADRRAPGGTLGKGVGPARTRTRPTPHTPVAPSVGSPPSRRLPLSAFRVGTPGVDPLPAPRYPAGRVGRQPGPGLAFKLA